MISTHESIDTAGHDENGDEHEAILTQLESEVDQDPTQEISHQEFLAHFKDRR